MPSAAFPERQGAGVSQITNEEIVIFGGFSGKFLRECYLYNVSRNTMTKATNQPDIDLFAFQMPTVLDKSGGQNKIITADWQSKRIIEYEYNGRFKSIKDMRNI